MKKILLITLLATMSMAGVRINASLYGDKYDFNNKVGANYSFTQQDELELNANASYYRSAKSEDINMILNMDVAYNAEFSPFMFLSYAKSKALSSEYSRLGYGIAWLLNDNVLHFPYRSKVSFAFINQTNSNLKLSLRYKIKGYYKKIGFNVVAFWLSGGKSLNTKLTYKLGSNVDGFYENNYIEESGLEDYYNLLGLEIKL